MMGNRVFFGLLSFVFCVRSFVSAQITPDQLDVIVTDVAGQSFSFDTGPGLEGATNTVEILVFDHCRIEGVGQVAVGSFYPFSTVQGIEASTEGATNAPGIGNIITYTFKEGIAQNTAIYTADPVANTAVLAFCVEIGLYTNGYLTNWEEVKILYNIDLTTTIEEGAGEPVSFIASADNFLASLGLTALSQNGLRSFFCDPSTYEETPADSTMSQGSIISICFNVVEGEEFEVSDILDLIVEDLAESQQSQTIVAAGDFGANGYAEQNCIASSNTTITCVVSFLLRASFYDYDSSELTGQGAAVVQLGDLAGGRKIRRLVKFQTGRGGPRRLMEDQTVATCKVKPTKFKVKKLERLDDKREATSGAAGEVLAGTTILTSILIAACLGLFWF